MPDFLWIDRKTMTQITGAGGHAGFDGGIALFALYGNSINDFHDEIANLLELRNAKAACRSGW